MNRLVFGGVCMCIWILCSVTAQAVAREQKSAPAARLNVAQVESKIEEMERVLGKTSSKISAIQFLHETISADARFVMSVTSADMPEGETRQRFEIGKEDFINTYIQGTNLIDSYTLEIQPVRIEISEDGQSALSEEILIERGLVLNPLNMSAPGKPFRSVTRCLTHHQRQPTGALLSAGATCHTDVGREEEA